MTVTRPDIIFMAANALGIERFFDDVDTDKSKEARVLRQLYPQAVAMVLADMDSDSMSEIRPLELYKETPEGVFKYAYKYPTDCARFRRIESGYIQDNRSTRIQFKIGMMNGRKCVFTNQMDAVGNFLSTDIPVGSLSYHSSLAVAYRLAILSNSLIVGKGSAQLRQQLHQMYTNAMWTAKAHDQEENFSFPDDLMESEFLQARLGSGQGGL